jgi:hypothetical protein
MIDAKESLKLPKEERQKHMDLSTPCKERGGNSTNHRGVLAEFLDTTIPAGRVILAHGCGNQECSNPLHLYWATDKENIVEDGIEFGTWKSPWEHSIAKHGYEEACRRQARGDKSAGGKANKGKPKSEEHKKKIAESIRQKNLTKKKESTILNK